MSISRLPDNSDSNQVALFGQCESAIITTYQRFSSGLQIGQAEFDQASHALEELERVETAFRNSHLGKNSGEHENVCQLRSQVEKMHGAHTHLVHRDLDLFQSFFHRREDKYFRTPNGELYLQPDDGGLFQLCTSHFSSDLYESFQLSRDGMLFDPFSKQKRPSTILFFMKHPDQIHFEKSGSTFYNFFVRVPFCEVGAELYNQHKKRKYEQRKEEQGAMLASIKHELENSLMKREYDAIAVLDTVNDLRAYGCPEEDVMKMSVIVLLYKKYDGSSSDSGKIEEVFDEPSASSAALPETARHAEHTSLLDSDPSNPKIHKNSFSKQVWSLIQRIKEMIIDLFRAMQRSCNHLSSGCSVKFIPSTKGV